MRFSATVLSRVATGPALGLFMASASLAEAPVEALSDTVARIEEQLGARVGIRPTAIHLRPRHGRVDRVGR